MMIEEKMLKNIMIQPTNISNLNLKFFQNI